MGGLRLAHQALGPEGRGVLSDDDPMPYMASTDELIFVGYTHGSIIGIHRPDIANPKRKIRQGFKSYGEVLSAPCDCSDEHVEVWVRRISNEEKTSEEVP